LRRTCGSRTLREIDPQPRHARRLPAAQRMRAAWWPAAQASLAAAVAWLIAHRLLSHADPFFAPIAAAMALSTTHLKRSRRIAQMVLGVLLGISIGSVLAALLGSSWLSLGITVLAALLIARALGVGFLGEGMVFANQAAASAILVVVLHRAGAVDERALDAVVGGAVAFVVGVVLFPAQPLPRLRTAERDVLASLASALERVVSLLRAGAPPDPGWTLAATYDVHQRLAQLADARTSARSNVRIAPRRWHLRGLVDAEAHRLARLHLLAEAVLGLVRAATNAVEDRQPVPPSLDQHVAALAISIGRLASTPQPWPPPLLRAVGKAAGRAIDQRADERADWAPVIASSLHTTARDLEDVITPDVRPRGEAHRRSG
jgi:uncharacterized membrane protein YgaE (UPF0421/DUF939 family)